MNSPKHIWIVNYYANPPQYVTNERHLQFAHHLRAAGYKVTMFSAGYLHYKEIDLIGNEKFKSVSYGEHDFVHVRVRKYKGNGLGRILSIFLFAWRIFRNRRKFDKPDIVLHNIHEPFDYPIFWCAKKLKAKYIAEDWDLWSRSFVQMGYIKKGGLISKIIFKLAENLFAKADRVVFSMEGGKDYICDMKWDKEHGGRVDLNKVYYINSGVDLEEFDRCAKSERIEDGDLLDDSYFKVIYLGSINTANNVRLLIDAAKILLPNPKIKFLIYGDGQDRQNLEDYCKQENITNVIFKQKRIPFSQVPFVLTHSNLNLLNYYQSFGQYGVSSGKLFQYMASGKPVCCNLDMKKYDVITRNHFGVAKFFQTSQEYADTIENFSQMSKNEYEQLCLNARKAADEFDYKNLSKKLIEVIQSL